MNRKQLRTLREYYLSELRHAASPLMWKHSKAKRESLRKKLSAVRFRLGMWNDLERTGGV